MSGAIAALEPVPGSPPSVSLSKIPLRDASTGRREYDLPAIVALLDRVLLRVGGVRSELFAVVERTQSIPAHLKPGALAQFGRGEGRGWAWMLSALRIPFELVPPQRWQRALLPAGVGMTKARALIAARERFRGLDLRSSLAARNADAGYVDALLMAEYARLLDADYRIRL